MKINILKVLLSRIQNYEFWPFWVLYMPFLPYWLYRAVQHLQLNYFSAANPSIRNGGFAAYSKATLLDPIPRDRKPNSQNLLSYQVPKLPFPFIVKPEMGERGVGVELIHNQRDWEIHIQNSTTRLIIQEYIDLPKEYGLFYYRLPWEDHGKILGITGKKFLTITGDGKTNIAQWIDQLPRARKRKKYLLQKFKNRWNEVPTRGVQIILEEIGNHNRGTEFTDESHLCTHALQETVDRLAKQIPGFYYGRMDVKSKSEEDLKKGHFVILEINGTNSEPTHIYDAQYSLYDAYQKIFQMLEIQHTIAQYNIHKQTAFTSQSLFIKDTIKHICFPKN